MNIVPQDAVRTTGARWAYVKALKPTTPRWFHVSTAPGQPGLTYKKPKVEVVR